MSLVEVSPVGKYGTAKMKKLKHKPNKMCIYVVKPTVSVYSEQNRVHGMGNVWISFG